MSGDRPAAPPPGLPTNPGLSYDPERTQLGIAAAAIEPPGDPTETIGATVAEPISVRGAQPGPAAAPRSVRFDLIQLIATGGLGEVWEAHQRSLDRRVAVKRVRRDRPRADAGSTGRMEALFEAEARVTANLEHPNIVPVYELDRDPEGGALLAMKLVEGEPWQESIERDLRLPLDQRLERHLPILVDVAEAVAFAHSRGVIHRDLKPAQVLVGRFGEVQVVDWGLAARVAGGRHAEGVGVDPASTSSPAGTPLFMAPEQTLDDPSQLGPWTDCYLLGGILHMIVTGRAPHHATTATEAFALAVRGEIVRRSRDPTPPPALEALLARCLDPSVEARRDLTAEWFSQCVRDWISGAGRRREAEAVRDGVAAQLEVTNDYRELRRLADRLDGARRLRPDLAGLDALEARLATRLAEQALSRGDLALAHLELERVDAATAAGLRSRIEDAAAARRAVERQRRLAWRISAGLAAVLAVGAGAFGVVQRRAAAALATERDAVVQARASAENLAAVMIEDLQERLLEIDRIDLLDPVAREVLAHYETFDPTTLDRTSRRRAAMAFGAVGKVFQDRGLFDAAEGARRRQQQLIEALLGEPADSVEQRSEEWEVALDAAVELASIARDTGRGDALDRFAAARRIAERAQSEAGSDTVGLRWERIGLDDAEGVARYDLGQLEESLELFARAAVASREIAEHSGLAADWSLAAGTRFREGVALADLGRADAALAALADAEVWLARAKAGGVDVADTLLLFVLGQQAALAADAGDHQAARASLERAAALGRQLVAQNPTSSERRYSTANVLYELQAVARLQGDAEAADRVARELLEVAEPALAAGSLGYLEDTVVRTLVALGRVEEARPRAQRLLEQGWSHRGFREYCSRHGIHVDASSSSGR